MPPRGRTWLSRDSQVQPVEVNAHIGTRLRLRRTAMGLTQAELAGAAGVTTAQLQSYERGTTRVAAARLYRFSQCLSVPVTFFFEGVEGPPPASGDAGEKAAKPGENAPSPPASKASTNKDTAAILRAFRRISRPEDRKALLDKLNSEES